jgi:hypothetical protein
MTMKTLIVYAHLLAACVAIGIMVIQDLAIARSRGKPLAAEASRELKKSAEIIVVALIGLWLSGLTLVLLGYLENPQQYLFNEKLWAKFTVVCLLTINGVFLHFYSFPRVTSIKGVLSLSVFEQTLVAMTGAISSVSWLFACYLGIARPWNYTVDYTFIMLIYAALVVVAVVVAAEVMRSFRRAEPPLLTERIQLNTSRNCE